MVAPGVPTLTYGTRGIAAAELIVRGPATDLHSGIFGGAVANPGTALVRMLASLHDATGRVAVPGFYDAVRPIGGWERTAWAALPGGDDELLELTGVPALAGEAGYTGRERIWGRPTAEINGIGGGFQGEGSKTVIPRHAFAKLTFRLVPDQDPERVLAGVKAFLEAKVPPGVTMEFVPGHSGPAFSMDPASPWGVRVGRALERAFSKPVAMIREGGTIPILSELRSVLGGEILLAGLALPDCRAHGPDENFPIENFEAGVRLVREFLGVVGEC
jgi:acetylornithine deacetylase/succinyl-diaminopimelate desuccinylase-like protein